MIVLNHYDRFMSFLSYDLTDETDTSIIETFKKVIDLCSYFIDGSRDSVDTLWKHYTVPSSKNLAMLYIFYVPTNKYISSPDDPKAAILIDCLNEIKEIFNRNTCSIIN